MYKFNLFVVALFVGVLFTLANTNKVYSDEGHTSEEIEHTASEKAEELSEEAAEHAKEAEHEAAMSFEEREKAAVPEAEIEREELVDTEGYKIMEEEKEKSDEGKEHYTEFDF